MSAFVRTIILFPLSEDNKFWLCWDHFNLVIRHIVKCGHDDIRFNDTPEGIFASIKSVNDIGELNIKLTEEAKQQILKIKTHIKKGHLILDYPVLNSTNKS